MMCYQALLQIVLICITIIFVLLVSSYFMFVCVCNQVTDKQIFRAVEKGISSFGALSSELNVGTCCGKCKSCAKKVMRAAIQQNAYVQPLPVGFVPSLSLA